MTPFNVLKTDSLSSRSMRISAPPAVVTERFYYARTALELIISLAVIPHSILTKSYLANGVAGTAPTLIPT